MGVFLKYCDDDNGEVGEVVLEEEEEETESC